MQCGARNVACGRRRQEGDSLRDIFCRTQSAERDVGKQRLALCIRQRARHVGIDEARCHAVDGNVAAADFFGQRLGKPHDAGLAAL